MSTVKDEPKSTLRGTIPQDPPTDTDVKPGDAKPADEELGVPAMEFIARSLNQTARPKKEKKEPDAPPADDDDDPPLEPKPAKKPAAAKVQPPPPAQFDEEKLGAAVGRAVAEATKPKEPEKPAPDAGLSDSDKRRVNVLRQMETQFGEKYKGLADRYVENLKKVADHRAEWEKEHPDEEYNEEEHAEFLDALEAQMAYDEEDYMEAMADMKVAAKLKQVDEQVSERLKPIEAQERLKEHRPKIIENRDKVGNHFWERMGDDFKEVLKDGQINGETLAALKTSDPDTHDLVVKAAEASELYATETYLLDERLVEYDPQKPTHQFLSSFASDSEQRMLQREPEKQLDDEGRSFLPRVEYNKLPAAKRAKHWTFTYQDLGFLIAARIAKDTQKILKAEEEKFSRRAAARGISIDSTSPPVKSQLRKPVGDGNTSGTNGKPDSPSTPVGTRMAPTRTKIDINSKGGIEGFVSRAFGKS